jgi:hypothetical protein
MVASHLDLNRIVIKINFLDIFAAVCELFFPFDSTVTFDFPTAMIFNLAYDQANIGYLTKVNANLITWLQWVSIALIHIFSFEFFFMHHRNFIRNKFIIYFDVDTFPGFNTHVHLCWDKSIILS